MKKQLLCFIILSICGSAYAQVPSYVPKNGLVGWWPFNGNANDESGNGNNGTINGASLTNDRFGKSNKAYNFFSGLNCQTISIPNSAGLNPNNITINLWINTTDSNMTILEKSDQIDASKLAYGITFKDEFNGLRGLKVAYGIGVCANSPQNPAYWSAQNSFPNNDWIMITVIIKSNGNIYQYLNSKLVYSETGQQNFIPCNDPSSILRIGGPHWSNDKECFNGKIDDIGIWNRALNDLEISKLYSNCTKNITQQPVNQGMYSGNALFTCASNDTLLTYQWQSNSGMGWNNLSNAGQYNGANTDSLIVNNVSSANNNQLFRCIIKGNCLTDTTQEATLRVWGLGINGVNLPEFKLYPNPSNNAVTIAYSQNPYSIALYNSLGQMVLSQSALTNEHTFDISQWPKGVYYVELIDAATQTNKVQKLIRN